MNQSVSIVIPAFNAAEYLAEAINSALSQSVPAAQVIVVDDCSTDDTYRVACSFGESIEVYRHPENKGVSAARNTGAQNAKSDWLLFLDADDVLAADALMMLTDNASDERYGVIYGGIVEFDAKTGETRPRGGGNAAGLPPYPAKANFARALIVTPGAAVVRKDLHDKIGGFEKPWQPTEDRDYWMKLGVLTGFKYLPDVVLRKREHPKQSVKKYDQTLVWGLMVQIEYYDWLSRQKIDAGFLQLSKKQVVNKALMRAINRKRYSALCPMVRAIRQYDIVTPLYLFIRLMCTNQS